MKVRSPFIEGTFANVVIGIAGVQVLAAVAMSLLPNTEGWLAGALYFGFYALPMVALSFALRSRRPGWVTASGIIGALLVIYYMAIVVGNWAGYSNFDAWRAVLATIPAVAGSVVLAWAAIVSRRTNRLGRVAS
jgi:hypothetical protein